MYFFAAVRFGRMPKTEREKLIADKLQLSSTNTKRILELRTLTDLVKAAFRDVFKSTVLFQHRNTSSLNSVIDTIGFSQDPGLRDMNRHHNHLHDHRTYPYFSSAMSVQPSINIAHPFKADEPVNRRTEQWDCFPPTYSCTPPNCSYPESVYPIGSSTWFSGYPNTYTKSRTPSSLIPHFSQSHDSMSDLMSSPCVQNSGSYDATPPNLDRHTVRDFLL